MAMKRDARRGDAFTERVVHRLRGDLNALEGSKLAELAPKGFISWSKRSVWIPVIGSREGRESAQVGWYHGLLWQLVPVGTGCQFF